METAPQNPTTAPDGTKNEWEEKVWGLTICEQNNNIYSRHRLQIKAGGYCSVHYHRGRANQFQVLSGHLRVVEAFAWDTRTFTLKTPSLGHPVRVMQVPSLVVHQFQAITDCEIIEEYFPDRGGFIQLSDIERLSVGGIMDPKDIEKVVGLIRT